MLNRIVSWIKKNKLTTILVLVIIYLVLKNRIPSPLSPLPLPIVSQPVEFYPKTEKMAVGGAGGFINDTQQNQMITKESYLSLVVKNVVEAQKKIIDKTQKLGGFMVQSYLDSPQETPTATLTIRLPAKKLDQALFEFKKLAVKVVSENLSGVDITQEYTDIEERLKTLYKTKAKFEEIMEQATKVSDILEVQRELINLQQQIDSLVGQKKYLEKSATFARITIYLSTDELSLPYIPTDNWRPKVVFKEAVRSLVLTLRKIGTVTIWALVYLPLILPLIAVYYFWRKRKNKT